jgi:hypothetical protein
MNILPLKGIRSMIIPAAKNKYRQKKGAEQRINGVENSRGFTVRCVSSSIVGTVHSHKINIF